VSKVEEYEFRQSFRLFKRLASISLCRHSSPDLADGTLVKWFDSFGMLLVSNQSSCMRQFAN
jgi:hypothetical protein